MELCKGAVDLSLQSKIIYSSSTTRGKPTVENHVRYLEINYDESKC